MVSVMTSYQIWKGLSYILKSQLDTTVRTKALSRMKLINNSSDVTEMIFLSSLHQQSQNKYISVKHSFKRTASSFKNLLRQNIFKKLPIAFHWPLKWRHLRGGNWASCTAHSRTVQLFKVYILLSKAESYRDTQASPNKIIGKKRICRSRKKEVRNSMASTGIFELCRILAQTS